MLEVSSFWRKKAYRIVKGTYLVGPRGRRLLKERVEREYLAIGDYVSLVLGITDPASHYTAVRILWDHINRNWSKDFLCVEIEKRQTRRAQSVYGFYVRKDWRPDFGLFREAI